MAVITAQEALDFITKGSKGRFFSVEFIKRTTGERRLMNARYGVKSRLRGGPAAYDHASKKLVCVWDRHKEDYRTIPYEGMVRIRINGVWIDVAQEGSFP